MVSSLARPLAAVISGARSNVVLIAQQQHFLCPSFTGRALRLLRRGSFLAQVERLTVVNVLCEVFIFLLFFSPQRFLFFISVIPLCVFESLENPRYLHYRECFPNLRFLTESRIGLRKALVSMRPELHEKRVASLFVWGAKLAAIVLYDIATGKVSIFSSVSSEVRLARTKQ